VVKERYSRPLRYDWTISATSTGYDVPSFTFAPETEGTFVLNVSASNNLTTLCHQWVVHVRRPVTPVIADALPADRTLALFKHETIDFSIEVRNPDAVPYSSVWIKDDSPIDGDDPLARSVGFETSGGYVVVVNMFTASTVESVRWEVQVRNRAPVINATTPDGPGIEISADGTWEFGVDAFDPDMDTLSYVWTFVNMTAPSRNSSMVQQQLIWREGSSCQVRVVVSDGEDEVEHLWTVLSKPLEPKPSPERHGSFFPWAIAFMVMISVLGYSLWRMYKRHV
jgi:hypothetical protein